VTGGWAVLLDDRGALLAAVPPSATVHLARVQTEIGKFDHQRSVPTTVVRSRGEAIAVRSVGLQGRTRGYLAVGRGLPLNRVENSLVDTTTFLLAGDLLRNDGLRQATRNNRKAVLDLLLEGHGSGIVQPTAETLGVRVPEGRVRVALLGAPSRFAAQLLEMVEDNQALRRIVRVIAQLSPGRVAIVFPEAEGDVRTLETILRQVPHGRGAVSSPTILAELPAAWARVQAIFQTVGDLPDRLHVAGDAAEAGLLHHLTTPEVREWSTSTLDTLKDLDRRSKVDFTGTLRVFLSNNGRADASAAELGIHRHTFRYRMGRIEEALGRDLDDPTVRSELWIALQLSQD
jgi:purine catabolism regulator